MREGTFGPSELKAAHSMTSMCSSATEIVFLGHYTWHAGGDEDARRTGFSSDTA